MPPEDVQAAVVSKILRDLSKVDKSGKGVCPSIIVYSFPALFPSCVSDGPPLSNALLPYNFLLA